jgi:O-glycosyl hydrolase
MKSNPSLNSHQPARARGKKKKKEKKEKEEAYSQMLNKHVQVKKNCGVSNILPNDLT